MVDDVLAPPPLAPGFADLLRTTERDIVRAIVKEGDVIDAKKATLLGALTGRAAAVWLLVPFTADLFDALAAFDAENEDAEDDTPAEEEDDLEPILGAREIMNQERAWRDSTNLWRLDAEFEGDGIADADLEDTHDREDDPAERSGIGDLGGLGEQLGSCYGGGGEPSLSATEDLDQTLAWRRPHVRAAWDGEMQGDEGDSVTALCCGPESEEQ